MAHLAFCVKKRGVCKGCGQKASLTHIPPTGARSGGGPQNDTIACCILRMLWLRALGSYNGKSGGVAFQPSKFGQIALISTKFLRFLAILAFI